MADEEYQFPYDNGENNHCYGSISPSQEDHMTDIVWIPNTDMAAARQAEEAAATGCSDEDTAGHGSKSPIDESEEYTDMKKCNRPRIPNETVVKIYLHGDIPGCKKNELNIQIAAKFHVKKLVVQNIRDGVTYREITHPYMQEPNNYVVNRTSKLSRSNRSPFVESSTGLKCHTKEDALEIYAAKREVQRQGLVGVSKMKREREVRKALTEKFKCTPKCIAEIWRARHQPEFTEELWEDGMREKAKNAKHRRSKN